MSIGPKYLAFCTGMGALVNLHPGASCGSWGRSVAHNAAVGGKENSQHLAWTACDITFDPGSEPDPIQFRADAAKVGLLAIPETGSVQVSPYATHDHWHLQLLQRS